MLSALRGIKVNIIHQTLKPCIVSNQKEYRWAWLLRLFNKIDYDRLKKVGPDRNCAEWVLKNGGSVRFEVQNELIKDYNELAPENSGLLRDHLVEIYADGAVFSNNGFHHMENCKHIKKITFISCVYVGDPGLEILHLYLKNSLKYLEIRSCHEITEIGLMSLAELRQLDKLILADLKGVREKEKHAEKLKQSLPNTVCDFNL